MTEQTLRPEKSRVARAFGNAANSYDDVAILQRDTADEMLERLDLVKITPQQILDLGTGTGRNLHLLQQRYPAAQQVALDIAPAMLKQARQRYRQDLGLRRWLPGQQTPIFIAGDAEQLPLADNSVDLVYANLALQWCDLTAAFAEIQRVLRPGGLLMFSTLGPDTLQELRQSWAAVDSYPHINVFLDMHDVAEAMFAAGLSDPVLDSDRHSLLYNDIIGMMRDLQQLGARNVNQGRRRGLTGKNTLNKVKAASEQFRVNGQLPATYEVIYGHAWAGENSLQMTEEGCVPVSLEKLRSKL
ncbi:malonyl-ACP O-methyltransferase BioC [Methylophaga muralis]|uniref:Malonyl-[acyl-carrier protein] O-methyltransferase n=1 Tax=Methylophaga muralis TaxID=291169 RepID=A0A1E3GV48_9GAMM|nr:malonyl-ACP O-methyltransferase BioC [Methylophaga muralis]ODN67958.1 Malonyl-[acyl-carrier protein] O-methyltransferase [Methylophaga muralis]